MATELSSFSLDFSVEDLSRRFGETYSPLFAASPAYCKVAEVLTLHILDVIKEVRGKVVSGDSLAFLKTCFSQHLVDLLISCPDIFRLSILPLLSQAFERSQFDETLLCQFYDILLSPLTVLTNSEACFSLSYLSFFLFVCLYVLEMRGLFLFPFLLFEEYEIFVKNSLSLPLFNFFFFFFFLTFTSTFCRNL